MLSLPLWPNEIPHALGNSEQDVPTLDVYEPFGDTFRNAAILILPGGGYGMLAAHEGEGFAGFFQLHGFHAFVLNYRLGSAGYRHPVMLKDAARALRTVRSRARTDGFDPNKVVIIGCSAGGHLAATLLTQWDPGQPDATDPIDRESSRPDLGVLCYPVITMGPLTHEGSRDALLGVGASQEQVEALSAERNVRADTPPCFLWHTWEDAAVPVENPLSFAQALRSAGVPFELHVYQEGRHGLGMNDGIPWSNDCVSWLRRRLLG
jgi:acetyl esterase/lipase